MRRFIILTAVIFLCQCKKDPEKPYSNANIVMDNAQASLYFHTVFREAENAWAFIDSFKYEDGTYHDKANRLSMYKELTLTHDENRYKVVIDYNAWETNYLSLSGTITVTFDVNSYHMEGKIANVLLTDFSINQHYVVGSASIKCNKPVDGKDNYTFTLRDGAAIHERGYSMPVLISGVISNGQYERIEGNDTLEQEDDVWAYTGVMTGLLHDDPNLKYTNTVNTTSPYIDENGVRRDGKVHYSMNCKFAELGLSQIALLKRPAIVFVYACSGYYFESVEHID